MSVVLVVRLREWQLVLGVLLLCASRRDGGGRCGEVVLDVGC